MIVIILLVMVIIVLLFFTIGSFTKRKTSPMSPMMENAVKLNQTESIRNLKKSGIDLEAINSEGKTAMFIAAALGNIESIKCLKELGAKVNAKDHNGRTPIFIAAFTGQIESMKCLKELGAKLNVKDKNGGSPMEFALIEGHHEAVEWLERETGTSANKRNDNLEKGIFTDPRDGKKYRTVTIGKQTWMAENLNYEASSSKYYDNNLANAQKYGRLYNWETAKMACPPGWHLPSDKEWQELVDFAGGEKIAGKKLKATNGWVENGNGTDEYGFSALPGGYCRTNGMFQFVGSFGGWLSSTEENSENVYYRNVGYEQTDIFKYTIAKTTFFSVRCIKD